MFSHLQLHTNSKRMIILINTQDSRGNRWLGIFFTKFETKEESNTEHNSAFYKHILVGADECLTVQEHEATARDNVHGDTEPVHDTCSQVFWDHLGINNGLRKWLYKSQHS